jgi:hypothetical protein
MAPRYKAFAEWPTPKETRDYFAECERAHKASEAWVAQLRQQRTMRPTTGSQTPLSDDAMINARGLSRGNIPAEAVPTTDGFGRQAPLGGVPEVRTPPPLVNNYRVRPSSVRDLTPEEMYRAQAAQALPTEGTPGLPVMPAFQPSGIPGVPPRVKA